MSGLGCKVRFSALFVGLSVGVFGATSGCAPDEPEGAPFAAAWDEGEAESALARIQRTDLVTQLLPSNEVPPVPPTNPEGQVSGTGTLRLVLKRNDNGRITSAVAGVLFSLCGLPGTSFTVTKMDVREGAPGVSNPVVKIFGTVSEDEPATFPVVDGCLKEGFGGIVAEGESLGHHAMEVIQNPTGFYLEIRTATNPAGLARGQLDYMSAP